MGERKAKIPWKMKVFTCFFWVERQFYVPLQKVTAITVITNTILAYEVL